MMKDSYKTYIKGDKRMKNRKDIIKNIAIIFLAVLLVLTFFSNTIMNRSLVEVSTQMISGDSITSKVRGSGTATAGDTYAVSINESRKIATINVKTGQEIEEGTVLFTLTETDSDELVTAQESLLSTQRDYELAVLTAEITPAEREAIENGTDSTLSEKQNAILAAKAAITDAQNKVNDLTAKKTALENSVPDTSEETAAYAQAQKELADAELDKTNKEVAYQTAQTKYNDLVSGSSSTGSTETGSVSDSKNESQQDASALEAAKTEMNDAYEAYMDALTTYNELNALATQASKDLDDAKDTTSSTSQAGELTTEIEAANRTLEKATNDYSDLSKKYSSEVSLRSQYESILKLEEKIAKLQENASALEVTAPITGTIVDILYTAGQTTSPQETVMTIQPENKAYTLQFTVTQNQAKRISVGDNAEIMYNYYGRDVSAKVTAIRRDTSNRDNMIVVCEMSGDVNAGESYTVSIGEQSASYDYIVPTSSIREDSNGKFILTIEAKSTPLGNRYYARRVDVEVLTSDDTRSAISGTLNYGDYVITTTTKPIEADQQVRLASEG
jgi:multidrug efflux pump subunit AcrA (membrane-fusion protein)